MPGSEMTGIFFTGPVQFGVERITATALTADLILLLVPISDGEREFLQNRGWDDFLTYLEEYDVSPKWDLNRKPAI